MLFNVNVNIKQRTNKIKLLTSSKFDSSDSGWLSSRNGNIQRTNFIFFSQFCWCFNRLSYHIVSYTLWISWIIHCVKSVQIQSFLWSVFSCIRAVFSPNAGKYGPEKNSVSGHFSRNGKSLTFENDKLPRIRTCPQSNRQFLCVGLLVLWLYLSYDAASLTQFCQEWKRTLSKSQFDTCDY